MAISIRERMMAVYRNQQPDRPPVSIYKRYLKTGQMEREVRNNGLGLVDFVPAVSLIAPLWHMLPGYMSEVRNAQFNVRYVWDNGELIQVRTYETPVGNVTAHVGKDAYGSEWIRKHYIETTEDYKVVQFLVENTILKPQHKLVKKTIAEMGEDGVVLGRIDRQPYQKLLTELANPEKILVDLYTDPVPVLELMETMDAKTREQYDLALESEAALIWNPDNVTSDLTPPDLFKRFCAPVYDRMGPLCAKQGKTLVVHMDGRLNALKDLIAESPFHVLESFSFLEMNGDIPIEIALESWKNKVICPNFPASIVGHTPEWIRDYLDQKRIAFANRPFMIQVSEDLPDEAYGNVLPVLCAFAKEAG